MFNLQHKVAIVTGAASSHGPGTLDMPGIGSATSELLARLGAKVVLADLDVDTAEQRAAAIRAAGGEAIAVELDVRDEAMVARAVEATVREYGRLDILHNNAADLHALYDPGDPEIVALDVRTYRSLTDVLVLGPMLCCKHAIPVMIAGGGGSIICTSSVSGQSGELSLTVYGACKAALNQLVRAVSAQYGKRGVRCNAVAPGLILTPPSLRMGAELIAEYERHADTPYNGEAGDVAAVVAFLASDAARFVTGQVLPVDGGLLSHHPSVADSRVSGNVVG